MSSEYLIQSLQKQLISFKSDLQVQKEGNVIEVGDGIAKISGLADARQSEMLECITRDGSSVSGVVLNLEEDTVGAMILGDFRSLKEGDRVKPTGRILEVPVGTGLVGRVVDALGSPIDGQGPVHTDTFFPIEKIAPGVITRQSVRQPLITGITAVDAMIPIGRGQRELIIGDRQTGKTAVAIDAIISQKSEYLKGSPVFCIYVGIGQKESKIAKIVSRLSQEGAMDYTTIVLAGASDPAAMSFIAPYAACAMGEYFMEKGSDVLIVYDDLSKHAVAYRQLSLLLRRPPGREAYPGDIFYLHSRLLERAAKLNPENGGGSLTALPIIETQAGDVSAYIPTNVISITDGQIYLETDLFYQGIRPALNVGLSVSRVGSSAQTKAMKKVAGRLRLDLAQYRELAAFAQFGSDLDEATQKQINRGKRLTELLKQGQYKPRPVEQQVVLLYAGVNGYLDAIEAEKVQSWQEHFIKYVESASEKTVLEAIKTTGELSDETEKALKKAISDFNATARL